MLSDGSLAGTVYRRARRAGGVVYRGLQRLPAYAAERGLPPSWMGYSSVAEEAVADYASRCGVAASYETLEPAAIAENPLPCNVEKRDHLPRERGWWGYSFHDVPERRSGETFIATVPDCRIFSFIQPGKNNYYPCILNPEDRALRLREMPFRAGHRDAIRNAAEPQRFKKATWVLERVYHNHSHWLTAHLPKICLLKERGALSDLLLPEQRNAVIDDSLRMLGLDPDAFPTFDRDRPLEIDELTVLGTDRFRPELLRRVRAGIAGEDAVPQDKRVFISRANSNGRQLLDEEEIWPLLEEAGFERVFMEDLTLAEQVELMRRTQVLLAPHGAGLTNMIFCQPGTQIVELADLGFPNPNFYAVASAMGHGYWLVPSEGVGDVHPLECDLRVGREPIRNVLRQVESALGGRSG